MQAALSRRAFVRRVYRRNRTFKKTVMSGRIKAGFVDFVVFWLRSLRSGCRFWCEIGAVRHTSSAGQRVIDPANREPVPEI